MLNNTFVPPGETGFESATDDAKIREEKAKSVLTSQFEGIVLISFLSIFYLVSLNF